MSPVLCAPVIRVLSSLYVPCAQATFDLRDPKQREDVMVALLEQANQCMMEGKGKCYKT